MSNHTHICLYYENIQEVSKFMHVVNSIYANYYNYLENRVGYVFKNRFYSGQIINEKQLFNTIAYIHYNPVKASIVKSMREWEFSTYNKYINNEISKQVIKLVFQKENYMDDFFMIHNNRMDNEIFDVEEEFLKSAEEIINDFLKQYNVSMKLVKKEKNLLFELIIKMKKEGKVLNKDISKILNLNKNTITKILKKVKI